MSEEKKDSQTDPAKEQGQKTERQTPTLIPELIHFTPFPIELLTRKADNSKT